jgi:hypothetical protein
VLFKEGAQVPFIEFVEDVGNAFNLSPEQISET